MKVAVKKHWAERLRELQGEQTALESMLTRSRVEAARIMRGLVLDAELDVARFERIELREENGEAFLVVTEKAEG